MSMNGTIARLNNGYGFLSQVGVDKDIFFHVNELSGVQFDDLRVGDVLAFDIIQGPKGPTAVSVKLIEEADELDDLPDAEEPETEDSKLTTRIRTAISEVSSLLAYEIAKNPKALDEIEWRDLERVIAGVFTGLGFEVELTPGSKDGGKDIIVKLPRILRCYYIEIKHWRSGARPGAREVDDFIHVLAHDRPYGGLFLSSSGFAKSAIESFDTVDRSRVAAGDSVKIQDMCQKYARSKGVWQCNDLEQEVIFEGSVLR